eukprot:1260772-Pleurochrysis_carterae.AAC.5
MKDVPTPGSMRRQPGRTTDLKVRALTNMTRHMREQKCVMNRRKIDEAQGKEGHGNNATGTVERHTGHRTRTEQAKETSLEQAKKERRQLRAMQSYLVTDAPHTHPHLQRLHPATPNTSSPPPQSLAPQHSSHALHHTPVTSQTSPLFLARRHPSRQLPITLSTHLTSPWSHVPHHPSHPPPNITAVRTMTPPSYSQYRPSRPLPATLTAHYPSPLQPAQRPSRDLPPVTLNARHPTSPIPAPSHP